MPNNKHDLTTLASYFHSFRKPDDQAMASYIYKWHHLAQIDNWNGWAADVLKRPVCDMSAMLYEDLILLNTDMQCWDKFVPVNFIEFIPAFSNFREILNYLLIHFSDHIDPSMASGLHTFEKPPLRSCFELENHEHTVVTCNAICPGEAIDEGIVELTKAANHIIDLVTARLIPTYRSDVGYLQISQEIYGMNISPEIEYTRGEKDKIIDQWRKGASSING